jgi:WD40 repeat protein
MYFDKTSTNLCQECAKEQNIKYNNIRRSKLRMSAKDYNTYRDKTIMNTLEESWISIVNPPSNVQSEESCLFMLNFDKNGEKMVTSSVNVIDIWDFKSKEKLKSLTDHTEIVTGLEWMKSPLDDLFISCSLDKTMKIWKDYKCIHTLDHHQDWLRCMSISKDNQYLVSGCVSSVIWGYDLNKQKPLFSLANKDGKSTLNTINSLNFQQDVPVFLCGTRDGFIKLFDIRANPTKPIQEIFSHKMKLNSAVFGQNNNIILSAGRDSTARLWDLRKLEDIQPSSTKKAVDGYIVEYRGHASHGYNIASHFFVNDKYVITGSEDGYIYIYDTQEGNVVRKIAAGMKIIHLLKPYPNPDIGFAYSGLQRSTIHFYDAKTTEDSRPKKEVRNKVEQMGNDFNESTVKFIEDFMSENGDLILKVFHSNNITYSSGMTWDNLLKVITREEDEDSIKLNRKLNEVLMRNMQQYLQNPESFGNREPAAPTEPQEKVKKVSYRDIYKPTSTCETCKEKQTIARNQLNSLTANCDLLKNLP